MAAALGVAGLTRKQRLQVSLLFPAAEIVAPLAGLLAGRGVADAIGGTADYVAGAALVALGLYLLLEDHGEEAERAGRLARAGGWMVVLLAATIAIDELALGLSIGLLRLSIAAAVIMIAVQAVLSVQLGLWLGAQAGERVREGAERLAGLALLGIGIFLLAEKLAS